MSATSSALNRGNSSSILLRPASVSVTRTSLPSSAVFERRTYPRPSSVVTTPVDVGRLIPTAAARSRDSISPHTQSTHIATNDVHDSRSSARILASMCRRIAADARNRFETAAIARKSSGRWPSSSTTLRSAGSRSPAS